MRLAQIARKVGLTPVEVKRFLEREFEVTIGNEPNYKLDDSQINSVLEAFPIPEPEIQTPVVTEVSDEISDETASVMDTNEVVETVEDNAASIVELAEEETQTELPITEEENEVEAIIEVEETAAAIPEVTEKIAASAVEINYDEPDESNTDSDAPFVEVPVDREAELIKAPTVKLDGLKVLGKIELPAEKVPEVVEKTVEEVAQEEADAIADLDAAMQLNAQDIKPAKINRVEPKETKEHLVEEETFSEFKDKRGIYHFSHQQKVNREKALIRIEQVRRLEEAKEKKKRHYAEIMKERKPKETATIPKAKQKKIEEKKQKREEKAVEPPKTLWGKFKRWLND